MRAAQGLADNLVDQPQCLQAIRGNTQRLGSDRGLVRTLPQDGGTAFRRNDRVSCILQHQHGIAHRNRQRTTGTAFADDGTDDGHLKFGHHIQVLADGFGLPALFRPNAGISAWRIDERHDRNAELLGQSHQAHGLAVAFRTRHTEVAVLAFLGVAAFLVADDHHALAVEPGQTADDGGIVRIITVAMQLFEIGKQVLDIIQRIGTLRVARNLRNLPRRELGVNILGQRLALLLQSADLIRDIKCGIILHIAQLLDLALQLGDRLLEIQKGNFHLHNIRVVLGADDTGSRPFN